MPSYAAPFPSAGRHGLKSLRLLRRKLRPYSEKAAASHVRHTRSSPERLLFPRKRTASPASSLPASSLRRTETAFGTIRKIFSATPMAAQAGSLCALPRGRKQTSMTEGFPRKRGAAAGTYAPAACFSENRSAPLRKGACQNFCSLPESFLPRAGFCLRHGGTEKGISPEPGASDSFLAFGARYVRQEEGKTRVFFFLGFGQEKGSGGAFFPAPSFCGLKNGAEAYFFGEAGHFFLLRRPCFFPGFKNFSARLHHSSADGAGVQKKIRILSLFQERKREVKI